MLFKCICALFNERETSASRVSAVGMAINKYLLFWNPSLYWKSSQRFDSRELTIPTNLKHRMWAPSLWEEQPSLILIQLYSSKIRILPQNLILTSYAEIVVEGASCGTIRQLC